LRRKRLKDQEVSVRVHEALELVDLRTFTHRVPETLSGGEQQRVAIARALVNRPTVLLLDEPLSALDLKIRRRMQRELKRIHQDVGTTFLYVTHDQEEALVLADRIAVMRGGHCEQIGTGAEIYNAPVSHFVADFIGETNWFSGTLSNGVDGPHIIVADNSYLKVTSAHNVSPNTNVAFGVRPERIRLVSNGEPQRPTENRISATITKRIFQGSNLRLEGKTSWGEPVELTLQIGGDLAQFEAVAPGRVATISWDVDATLLFPT
jgi:spermidine/putrescine transport system ATP-binding protein